MTRKRNVFYLALGLGLCLLCGTVVGAGPTATVLEPATVPGATPKGPIRIGVMLSMTGAGAAYGQMEWIGIQVAMKMVQKTLNRPVRLYLVDTKSDKIEAANAVNRLINKNKVVAIIGPTISSTSLAVAPIAETARVPMISPSATNPLVTQNRKYAFRTCFIDPFQGIVAARYAYRVLGKRRAAIIIDIAQDYSVGLAKFFAAEFTRLGGKVVAKAFCQSGDQDFTAQISSIIPKKPDILYLPNYYTEDALIAIQARQLKLTAPILSGDGAQAMDLINIGKKAVEGFMLTGHFHPRSAATKTAKRFLALFKKKYPNKTVTAFHALGADAYLVLMDAIGRAGSTNPTKIRDALAATRRFPGVSGIISIDHGGNAVKSAVILEVKGGQFVYRTTVNP
ncbi:MAG: ABC transporter substrate-binding protein [Proteobacteria bacterium]|nr:ABC transporter substrate-binding protein [Pseudomonadota bacterium]